MAENDYEETVEDQLFCLVGAVLNRINEKRPETQKLDITDREKGQAIRDYLKYHTVELTVYGDPRRELC